VQKRKGGNLGDVLRALRPWLFELASSLSRPDPQTYLPDLKPVSRDLIQVRARYAAMTPVEGAHPYLLIERLIPAPSSPISASPAVSGATQGKLRKDPISIIGPMIWSRRTTLLRMSSPERSRNRGGRKTGEWTSFVGND
jgi:hypothetical protein